MTNKQAAIFIGGDFKETATQSTIFADKSLFIKEIIEDKGKIILICMPRRWGKSCNLEMLEAFLSVPIDDYGKLIEKEDHINYKIFSGRRKNIGLLNICNSEIEIENDEGELVKKDYKYFLNEYPVISIDFKNCKADSLVKVENSIKTELQKSFSRHTYLLKSDKLSKHQQNSIRRYIEEHNQLSFEEIKTSLSFLSEMLHNHHGKKAWILIDEYDAPANKAYRELDDHTTKEIVDLFREIYETSLKKNKYLEKAILTGVQYIAQSGMLSGLNNLTKYNIMDYKYAQYYGLNEEEIEKFTDYFELDQKTKDGMKDWYNGYQLIDKKINGEVEYIKKYNIWSVVNYLNRQESGFISYWEKSGSIEFINKIFKQKEIKDNIEKLIDGEETLFLLTSDFSVSDFQTLKEITDLTSNKKINKEGLNVLFSYLFITGYLTISDKKGFYKFPNKEIKYEMGVKIMKYYNAIYNIDFESVIRMADYLQQIFDKEMDAKSIKNIFKESFLPDLQNLINDCYITDDKDATDGMYGNEDMIHSILNYVGIHTVNTLFGTEIYTDKLGAGQKGRADILFRSKKIGIIIEVKYKGSAVEALTQAESYADLIDKQEKRIFVGLCVSEKQEVTINGKISENNVEMLF